MLSTVQEKLSSGMTICIRDRAQGEALAVEISCAIGEAMAPYTDGLYLMTPFNRISLMETIMERLG